jgi:hypothetical protein
MLPENNVPVLIITFARPEYARQVFEQVKKAKPKKLYFYNNKARQDQIDEMRRNDEVRSLVSEVDWNCELHTFLRDEYVDVYTSLQGAIDWLFENEEQGIILEEDCVPSLAFFSYCEHFLEKYRDDRSIALITGCNYVPNMDYGNADHVITRTFYMFGWACWRDRWTNLDYEMDYKFEVEKNRINDIYFKDLPSLAKYYNRSVKTVYKFVTRTRCWDYVVCFNCVKNNMRIIAPIKHLVQCVGVSGTHSSGVDKDCPFYAKVDLSQSYEFTNEKAPIGLNIQYDLDAFNVTHARNFTLLGRLSFYGRLILPEKVFKRLKAFYIRYLIK